MVTEFNAAAERMFRYVRSEAVGREMAELIIPERASAPGTVKGWRDTWRPARRASWASGSS